MSNFERIFSFDPPLMIVYGVLTGLVFGFLLQKGGVTRYQVILGQFLFKDFTVLKVMLTAIVVGAAGIFGMKAMGADFPMHIKGAALAANVIGGLIFGVGMAILGYCPGTGIAALGDGSRHAWPGLLGMMAGGVAFAEVYPLITDNVMKWLNATAVVAGKTTDKITLPDVTGISAWWFVAGLTAVAVLLFTWLEKREHPKADAAISA